MEGGTLSLAIISLILIAIVALLAIPLIAAVVGRSVTDEDLNRIGDPENDPNVEPTKRDGFPGEEDDSGNEGSGSEHRGSERERG